MELVHDLYLLIPHGCHRLDHSRVPLHLGRLVADLTLAVVAGEAGKILLADDAAEGLGEVAALGRGAFFPVIPQGEATQFPEVKGRVDVLLDLFPLGRGQRVGRCLGEDGLHLGVVALEEGDGVVLSGGAGSYCAAEDDPYSAPYHFHWGFSSAYAPLETGNPPQ